jgi:iron complex transport system ATP-binding protein
MVPDAADHAPASPPLQARGVSVSLAGREVLHAIDAAIQPGWTALVGPNGAGKSTLLRTLAGLQRPDAGEVRLLGRALPQWRVAERARQLAWLAQQGDTTGELTVRETVELGRIAHLGLMGSAGAADVAAVEQAMVLTECSAWSQRRLQALSGGERQRVLLARALATEAPLLLLDEPTTHLDAPHQVALARLFARLARRSEPRRTLLTVLHDLPIALQADRLLVLAQGRVCAEGPPTDIAVQKALMAVFGGAIRIEPDRAGRPSVVLVLDQD